MLLFFRCPWLEEIQLQDNRLEYIPPSIFSLKSLSTLDVSNNKLTFLPFEMWKAPQLKELNLSFNLLSELPVDDVITRERSFSKTRSASIHALKTFLMNKYIMCILPVAAWSSG